MFWLLTGLLLAVFFILMSLVKFSLRKLFKINKEKKELFSYNHINKSHQKVDWFVRGVTMLSLIVILYLTMYKGYPVSFFLIALILLTAIDYSVRAFFEWKYSDNPKQSILTIAEMAVLILAFAAVFQFDLLNLAY